MAESAAWRAAARPLSWQLLALLVIVAAAEWLRPGFVDVRLVEGRLFGPLVDVLNRGAPVMLLALGMTLVIATGGIDLSVGSIMAITGAAAAVLLQAGASAPAAIACGLAIGAAAGTWNGLLVQGLGLQPIVATLVLLTAGRGIAQLVTDGQVIAVPAHADGFLALAHARLLGLPAAPWLVLAVWVATAVVLHGSVLGLWLAAVGDNARAARLVGLPVAALKVVPYVVSGTLAALAGMVQTADIAAADVHHLGLYLELDAILAVVLGGTALTGGRPRLLGSLLGVLLVQTLTTAMLRLGTGPEYALVLKAIAVLAACTLQAGSIGKLLARRRRSRTAASPQEPSS